MSTRCISFKAAPRRTPVKDSSSFQKVQRLEFRSELLTGKEEQ